VRIKSPKDFWAGLMFIGFGLFFAIWAATFYRLGTSLRMGPAYFPTVLGALLVVIGLVILVGSLAVKGEKIARFHFRPLLLVLGGCVAFGYLMGPAGLIAATAALVVISAMGGHQFNWREVAILAVALIVFSVLVFVKGLTLPFPLWPAILQ
jgi:putative tricarboxylic transport membrane protein